MDINLYAKVKEYNTALAVIREMRSTGISPMKISA